MGQYNNINTWTYNCGKEDLDYRAIWGDGGSLIVHVPNLIMIRFSI